VAEGIVIALVLVLDFLRGFEDEPENENDYAFTFAMCVPAS
jgi:hypothetical protein